MQNIHDRARKLKLAAFDVDGILTDGALYLSDSGDEIKAFFSLDGHGMKMLRESGVELALITGRKSRIVELRAKNLGIETVYQGVEDKARAFAERAQRGLPPNSPAWQRAEDIKNANDPKEKN